MPVVTKSPTPSAMSIGQAIDVVAGSLATHSDEFERCLLECIEREDWSGGQAKTWRLGKGPGDFGRQFLLHFREFAAVEVRFLREGGPSTQGGAKRVKLEILSNDESELQAAVSAMAHRMGASLEDDVREINLHLAAILGLIEIPEHHSPVGQGVAVRAVSSVLQNFGFGGVLLRQLLKHISGPLTYALQQAYRNLEGRFAGPPEVHMPRVRAAGYGDSRPYDPSRGGSLGGDSRFGPPTLRGMSPRPLGHEASTAGGGAEPATATEMVGSLLHRLQSAPSSSAAASALNSGAPPGGSTAPAYWLPPLGQFLQAGGAEQGSSGSMPPATSVPPEALPLLANALMPLGNALAEVLRQAKQGLSPSAAPATVDEDAPLNASLAGMAALAEAAQEGERFSNELRQFHAWRNGLRELVDRGDAAGLSSRVAVDLVAEMFDSMCACELVPAVVRRKSLALQVALLKFSVHEPKKFFAIQRGCALAVERIAVSAVGALADDAALQGLWDSTIAAVASCMDDPTQSKDAMEVALRSLETAVEESYRDRSTRAIAERQAMEWMRRCVPQDTRVSFLKQFLLWTWSRVVAEAMRDSKLSEVRTPRYVKTARTAVWSVKLDLSAEQRDHLRRLMPALIRNLREGMRLLQWSKAAELEFLGKLMRSHRRALGLPDLDALAEPMERGSPPASPSAAADVAARAHGAQDSSAALPEPRRSDASVTPDSEQIECPLGLQPGHDYLVVSGGSMLRMRLQSASSSAPHYVFSGPSGNRLEFTSEQMHDMVLSAQVVPVEVVDEPRQAHV